MVSHRLTRFRPLRPASAKDAARQAAVPETPAHMRAIVFDEPGAADVLREDTVPD